MSRRTRARESRPKSCWWIIDPCLRQARPRDAGGRTVPGWRRMSSVSTVATFSAEVLGVKSWLLAVLRRSLPLMVPAVFADTSGHVCDVGAVPEVAPTSGHQGSLERDRPRFICLSEPPHLVWCHGEVPQRQAEWFAVTDRVEQLLAYLDGHTCSRFRPCVNTARSLCAPRHVAQLLPAFHRALLPCEA